MSSTTATPTSSNDAALQQQQSKQRKTLVSKILKRSSSMQTSTNDQKQSSTVGPTVTFNINKNSTTASEETGTLSIKVYIFLLKTAKRAYMRKNVYNHLYQIQPIQHKLIGYFRFKKKSSFTKRTASDSRRYRGINHGGTTKRCKPKKS